MAVIAKDEGKTMELLAEGQYVGRCVWVIDIGTHEGEMFGPKHQVVLGWELPEERRQYGDGPEEPVVITKYYTLSLNEKANLRRDLQQWRGKSFDSEELAGFDLEKLIGVPCLITITHEAKRNGEKRAAVSGLSKVPGGVTVPPQQTKVKTFSFGDPALNVLELMPEWLQAKIRSSAEYLELYPGSDAKKEVSDDIPF